MTQQLSAVLADYGAGLDAVLQLLTQLEALADRQHALPHPVDTAILTSLAEERQRLLAGLLQLETRLRPLRERVSADVEAARAVAGFQVVADRHRLAAAAVSRIMLVDKETLEALQAADVERRVTAQTVETAGATLAAYRRVLEGPQGSAGLVDERG